MGSGYEIARAIQRCVGAGHDIDRCWSYTPRQLAAFSELIARDQLGEDLRLVRMLRLSKMKNAQKVLKRMTEDSR